MRHRFRPPRPEAPDRSPRGLALLRALRTNMLQLWPKAAYAEDLVSGRIFGRRYFLFNSPGAIHRVLLENADNYRRPAPTVRILKPVIGEGVLLSEGEEARRLRRVIMPALAPRVLPSLVPHIARSTLELAARYRSEAAETVDLLSDMQGLALDIAARTMFSLEIGEHGAALRALIARYRMRLGQPDLLDVVLPLAIPTPRDFARRRFRPHWTGLMDTIIRQRLAAPLSHRPRDLFDHLLGASHGTTDAPLTQGQLRDQISTMIVAGHETSALAMFWSLYLLASVPEAQDRVAAEARNLPRAPEEIGTPELPYTRAVVNEALRLYPPAFLVAREAVSDDRCAGVAVPAGALVIISPWILGRHQRLWPDPDAFDPDRFLGGEAPSRYAHMPFGAGQRVCIGAQFAMLELTLALALLTRDFEIGLATSRPVVPAAVVSMQPDHDARFTLRRR